MATYLSACSFVLSCAGVNLSPCATDNHVATACLACACSGHSAMNAADPDREALASKTNLLKAGLCCNGALLAGQSSPRRAAFKVKGLLHAHFYADLQFCTKYCKPKSMTASCDGPNTTLAVDFRN